MRGKVLSKIQEKSVNAGKGSSRRRGIGQSVSESVSKLVGLVDIKVLVITQRK